MHGFVLLCDFAEAINGKLYIQGGGWSRIGITPNGAANIHVAALVWVPWNDANRRRRLLMQLFTEDGTEVQMGEPAVPVEMRGEVEVGRPPGLAPGTELELPIVARFEGLPISPGRYKFLLTVGATQIGEAKFEVVAGPPFQ